MADLPVVNAVDELKEQVTLDRQALQKSLRAGLLNVVKSIESLHVSFNEAFDVQKRMLDAQEAAAVAMREKELEDARKKKDNKSNAVIAAITKDIGYSGLLLAAAIGGVVGVIKGQIQAIKTFATMFSPKFVKNAVSNVIKNIKFAGQIFGLIAPEIGNNILSSIKNFGQNFLKLVKGADTGFFASVFNRLKSVFQPFVDTIKTAVGTIKDVTKGPVSKLKGFFGTIAAGLKTFGGVVAAVSGTVAKIFAPIAVVLTAFETIRGVIAGYAEGGFLGAIQGGIEAFFNTLIFKPLDMIKSLISAVIGFFGGDATAEALDSFSFEEMFNSLMDAIFSPFESIKKFFGSAVEKFKGLADKIKNSSIYKFFAGSDDEEVETPEPLAETNRRDSFDDSGFVPAEEAATQRLPEEKIEENFLLSDEEKAEKKRLAGLTKEEIEKERREALQKNIAVLAAQEAEQKKRIAESEAKIKALGYDDPMSLGRIEIGDEKAEAASDEQRRLMAAQQKLKNISVEKTMSQNELNFINDNPLRRNRDSGVNSNVNANITTNNTSAVNKTVAMPANAGRSGGQPYKGASAGFAG